MTGFGTDSAVVRLETAECWELLQQAGLGRLATTDALGAPNIVPVNFVAFEGALYVRTSSGSKLTHLTAHPVVAMECDGREEAAWWSVVVRGSVHALRDAEEFHASGAAALVPWAAGEKPFALKMTPHSVSGRRFPQASVEPETMPVLQVPDTNSPDEAHPNGRALPPVIIPGVPPLL